MSLGCLEGRGDESLFGNTCHQLRGNDSVGCAATCELQLLQHESNAAPRRLAACHTACPGCWEVCHQPHVIYTPMPLCLKLPRRDAAGVPQAVPPQQMGGRTGRGPMDMCCKVCKPTPQTEPDLGASNQVDFDVCSCSWWAGLKVGRSHTGNAWQ